MDNRAEVREFLISRRAKLTPQRAGLPNAGNRRVPGLRRGEVAALAGVSIEYYSKLERGALAGASATVLDAVPSPPRKTLDTPTQSAMGSGHHHRAGHRPKWSDGSARDQPPRPSDALLAV
jgi:hypothetical protein